MHKRASWAVWSLTFSNLTLLDEIKEIKSKGIDVNEDNFIISESANLILPFHREMDEIREDFAGDAKIGTTRRGIGPAYEDKVGRRAIRLCDLNDNELLKKKIIYSSTHRGSKEMDLLLKFSSLCQILKLVS